jgi:PAS domain S-box-containing protein
LSSSNINEQLVESVGFDLLNIIENNMSDIICIHTPDGCFSYVTRSVSAILGYFPADLVGSSPHDYVHPDDVERIRIDSHNRTSEGITVATRLEYRFRKKDGSYTWLQSHTTPILNSAGSIVKLFTVSRDISDRKQTEQALLDIEDTYRQLFMSSPAIRLTIDPISGYILDANQAAIDFYGYTAVELRTMTIYEINTATAKYITDYIAKVSDNYGNAIPFRHRMKDGTLKEVEVYSNRFRKKGKAQLHCIIIDMTARKRAEEELKDNREQLSLVVEGAKAGIWDWDMIENQVHLDRRWKEMLGYEEHEVNSEVIEWRKLWHPEDVSHIELAMQNHLDGKTEKFEVEYRLRHRDGTYRWILTNGKLTRDQDGRPTRWTGFNIDITKHKRTEELYLESEKRLRNFAEAVPDMSFIIDEDGQYIEAFGNASLFHIPKEKFRGLSVYQAMEEDSASSVLQEVRQSITSGMQRSGSREMKIGQEKRYFADRTVPLGYLVGGKRTAAVIVTDITNQRKTKKILQTTYELRRRSDFINDIINGRAIDNEKSQYFAKRLGIDFNLRWFGCMIICDKFDLDDGGSQGETINIVQEVKDSMIDTLNSLPNSVAWDCREGIGILCGATFETDEWESSKEIALQIRSALLQNEPSIRVYIGISDTQTGVEGLPIIYRQALNAARAAQTRIDKHVDILHYREAGIFQFIPEALGKQGAREFIERNLGKIIAYDREKRTNLLPTLEGILRDASVRETAERLFLHPRTVIFRRKRIGEILNIDIGAFETRLALAVAIELHKIYSRSID